MSPKLLSVAFFTGCGSDLEKGRAAYREKDYQAVQDEIDPARLGENEVFFLPYLMGERSPINDTDARGVFMGMSMNTTRADMAQAVGTGSCFRLV